MTPVARLGAVLLSAAPLAGCGLLNAAADAPGKLASALTPGEAAASFDPAELAPRLMRFADLFEFEIERSTEEFARAAGTVEARIQALDWYVDYTSAALKRATVGQPYAGLFDLILLVTGMRASHEERWLQQWGEADQVMIAALKRLEDGVWNLATEAMSAQNIEEAQKLVREWSAGDPDERIADAARLPGLGERLGKEGEEGEPSGLVGGLADLVRFDPLAGLEPAAREFEQTRALGERFFFYMQRFPQLAEKRVELATLRTSQASETRALLAGWERVSLSAEALATRSETLPAELSAELTRQREGLVADLETVREPVGEILNETRTTAETTRALSESLRETLVALGTFLDRFKKDESAQEEPAQPGGRPFDVTEYGEAGERIGVAVRELNATLVTLDQNLPKIERALAEVEARGKSTVDHAFRRGLELLIVGLLGGGAVVILVRWLSRPRVPSG